MAAASRHSLVTHTCASLVHLLSNLATVATDTATDASDICRSIGRFSNTDHQPLVCCLAGLDACVGVRCMRASRVTSHLRARYPRVSRPSLAAKRRLPKREKEHSFGIRGRHARIPRAVLALARTQTGIRRHEPLARALTHTDRNRQPGFSLH